MDPTVFDSPPCAFVEACSLARQMLHARSSNGPGHPSAVQEAKKTRKQTILTSEAAIQIFKLRPALKSPIDDAESRLKTSSSIAKRFGVSPKTVRDIWIGRTWYRQTFPLDPERPNSSERLSKQMGRPRGSKDKSPRSRRSQEGEPGIKPISPLVLPNPAVHSTASQRQCHEFATMDAVIGTLYPADEISIGSASLPADFALTWDQAYSSDAHCFGDDLAEFCDPFHNDWQHWPKQAGDL